MRPNIKKLENRRKYIVIYPNIFMEFHWERFGLNYFETLGWEVLGIECVSLLLGVDRAKAESREARADSRTTIIDEPNKLRDILAKTTNEDIVLIFSNYEQKSEWLFKILYDYNVHYGIANLSCPPVTKYKINFITETSLKRIMQFLDNLKHSTKMVLRKLNYFFINEKIKVPIKYPSFWIYSGRQSLYLGSELHRMAQKRISTHSLEVEKSISITTQEVDIGSKSNYAVLIDDALADHPDFNLCQIGKPISPIRYFSKLNAFIDKIELDLGLEVVIAANPKTPAEAARSNYQKRKLFFGKTTELIRDCSLVISHYSTALSIAAYFEKPIYILSTSVIKNSEILQNIEKCASWFETHPINIDELSSQKLTIPKIKTSVYRRYKHEFLQETKSTSTSIWQSMINAQEYHTHYKR